ncbi:MAG: DUF222 domain-containing protein [Microlunatus sp.]|nr:DUF222 domain-containing protein [Microlunatus sp.]MDN5770674.1 DUF222 domain-containing protein [Microlunatus sp.]
MSAAPIVESAEAAVRDPVTLRLQETLVWLGSLAVPGEPTGHGDVVEDAARIDRIALAEKLQAAIEAVKATQIVRFAKSQAETQMAEGVHPSKIGRGVADQVALAGRVSPSEGSRRLHTARDLCLSMPRMLRLLAAGEISGWTARLITQQTSHLDPATRQQVDADLAGQNPASMSPKQAETAAKRLAYEADPEAAMRRCRKARTDRRVTLRPAPDTMSLLSGLLPVEQGVACLAALQAAATQGQAAGDQRSWGQLMADTLVERITGQTTADDIATEVAIVIPVGALLDPDDPSPAEVADLGPIPAGLAREIIANGQARSWWRRLFTRPTRAGGQIVVDLDQRRRRFTGWLGELIRLRDLHCRDPYCDAPVRHVDHIDRHTDGGPTTLHNGRGVCERGNYVREMPGWSVHLVDPDTHTVITTTPTGHQYSSRPPQPP